MRHGEGSPLYTGLCIGGPLAGHIITHPDCVYDVLEYPPVEMRAWVMDQYAFPSIQLKKYTYHWHACEALRKEHPGMHGFWVMCGTDVIEKLCEAYIELQDIYKDESVFQRLHRKKVV